MRRLEEGREAWKAASPDERREALRSGLATLVEALLTLLVFALFFGAAALLG